MTEERDYLLGTHDAEVRRLGHQHRVWRPRVLDAWRRAGIKAGSTVIDAGAGPGWASLDLAEIVGESGRVIALERSKRFSDIMMSAAAQRGFDAVIAPQVMDLVEDAVSFEGVDAVWIRWVLAFVSQPAEVVAKLSRSLRKGGALVVHEYLNYESFSVVPEDGSITDFTRHVVDDWRSSGGEPNIGLKLPGLLLENGFRILHMTPLVDVVQPTSFIWQWPASWVRNYPQHLVDTGKVSQDWADRVVAALNAAEADAAAIMVTPTVVEIIAEKL
ncbi:MAG TPA: methyltransferase domain-containing protein [Brevundimonas sp.]|nr:methyltransferase domain-containing protein [Brevundimonas sp.]